MYGSCCTLTHQQQQRQQLAVCRTHEPLLMDEKLFYSLASRSVSSHHQQNSLNNCSAPPPVKPAVTPSPMADASSAPGSATRHSLNLLSAAEKPVNRPSRTSPLSIFTIGRQNSKSKVKSSKQESPVGLDGAGSEPEHQQLTNRDAADASNSSDNIPHVQVTPNSSQPTAVTHPHTGTRAQSVPVDEPSVTVVRTLSSTTITNPPSLMQPQSGQTNNTTVHSPTTPLANIHRQNTTAGNETLDKPVEVVSDMQHVGSRPDAELGNSTAREPLTRSAANSAPPRRLNSAGSGTSTLTDPRSKTCCFCWCCCFSCSCMRVRASLNDSHRPSSSNDPQSRGDNCSADDLLTPEEAERWGESFDLLMQSNSGRRVFREFLRSEYSDENIMFWLACEELKTETNPEIVEEKARLIYEDFISILSPREVSLDSRVREQINANMIEPTPRTFDEAQLQIYTLMHRDSYLRFLNSKMYKELLLRTATPSHSDMASLE